MIRTIFLAIAGLLSTIVPAADAVAGVTSITECGAIITTPGKYKLSNDLLSCPDAPIGSPPGAITIISSGVDLNLKGHTITCDYDAPFGAGVLVLASFTDIQIRNGSVANCPDGIMLIEADNSEVSNIAVTDNRGVGMWVIGGTNNTIRNNAVLRNRFGIILEYDDRFVLRNNTVLRNALQGIILAEGDGSVVRNNIVNENGGTGLEAFFQSNTDYLCNTANHNARAGIALSGMEGGNVLRGNVANMNGIVGISLFGRSDLDPGVQPIPENNLIEKNVALANGGDDLAELLFDFTDGSVEVEEPCRNTWQNNEFVSQLGPDMCIGTPIELNEDDVCAFDEDNKSKSRK
jgi:parallel beta-helix repeat protein